MKAVFIHDHYFIKDPESNQYYDGSGGVFTKAMWERYLSVFEELIVVGRDRKNLTNKSVLSSCDKVSFELVQSLKKNTDRYTNLISLRKELTLTLSKVDFAIIRVPSITGNLAQKICIKKNIPYVLEVVACPWDAYLNYGSILGKIIAPIERLRLYFSTQKAENTIYVTKEFLQNRYPTKGNQIAISNAMITNFVDLNSVDEFYSQSFQKFKIGMIGTFGVKFKGHVEAIKAIEILVSKGINDIELNFVGTGDSTWVKNLIYKKNLQDYINIIGVLKSGEDGILPFLDKMHVYIHPSKQEGLPRVIIEAMSRGRLCLGSDAAGIPELLSRKWIHKSGNYKQLANHIEHLKNNNCDWSIISENNLSISKQYSEENLQNKRVNFLNKIIS